MRPAPVLLDVDGVTNVLMGPGGQVPFEVEQHKAFSDDGYEYTLRNRPETREWLARLSEAVEIVWALEKCEPGRLATCGSAR